VLDDPAKRINAMIMWDTEDFPKAADWAAPGDAHYLIIQDGEGAMDETTDALGLPRLNRELVLLHGATAAGRR
jgi:hypothetical protein